MADASATASIEMRDEDASGDHESRWQAATKRIIFGRRVVETITMHSVESHVKKKRLVHSVSSVNVPSSDHGPHPLVPVRMGIHGDTTGRDYEAPDANFGATMHRVCRKRLGCMSAAELGRTCAKIDASSRRVIKAPWEDPALSAGGSSVFDPRLGGGGVFMKRGESRSFRPGDKVACQHSNASNNQHWHGRLGYRAVSALETYRSDPLSSKLSGACGPWMLMTMKPRFTRNREQLARSIPQLARTTQRPQSRETWEKYEPGVIFGSFRRFKSFSVHFSDPSNDAKAAVSLREDDASVSLNLVKLNRMWKELIVDPVGRIWYRLQVETQAFVTQRDKYQASLAKAEKKKIEEDNRKIEVLMERAALEKQEAEEALERVEKERAEFEKSWKRFEKEKEQFEQAVREAEEDDAVDDEETKRIAKEKMEMGIAEARMNKEMAEFHGWEAKAQKEIEEYEVIKARCDQRIAEQQAWLQEANARSMDRALMQFNQTYPSLSVLARLNAARLPDDHVEVEVYLGNSLEMEKNTDEQTGIEYAFVQNSDFVNYEGQWLNGQPTGYGIENLHHRGIHYIGQFEGDLWNGWGMFVNTGPPGQRGFKQSAYLGKWQNGRREGEGVLCGLLKSGTMVPIIKCQCREGLIHEHVRFEGNSFANHKLMESVVETLSKAIAAAKASRNLRNPSGHAKAAVDGLIQAIQGKA